MVLSAESKVEVLVPYAYTESNATVAMEKTQHSTVLLTHSETVAIGIFLNGGDSLKPLAMVRFSCKLSNSLSLFWISKSNFTYLPT